MNTRLTITVDEANYDHYLKDIKGKMYLKGIGELSFSSYVNICMAFCPLSFDQIVSEGKKRKKYGDHWNEQKGK